MYHPQDPGDIGNLEQILTLLMMSHQDTKERLHHPVGLPGQSSVPRFSVILTLSQFSVVLMSSHFFTQLSVPQFSAILILPHFAAPQFSKLDPFRINDHIANTQEIQEKFTNIFRKHISITKQNAGFEYVTAKIICKTMQVSFCKERSMFNITHFCQS